jgi:hypothetical protein
MLPPQLIETNDFVASDAASAPDGSWIFRQVGRDLNEVNQRATLGKRSSFMPMSSLRTNGPPVSRHEGVGQASAAAGHLSSSSIEAFPLLAGLAQILGSYRAIPRDVRRAVAKECERFVFDHIERAQS